MHFLIKMPQNDKFPQKKNAISLDISGDYSVSVSATVFYRIRMKKGLIIFTIRTNELQYLILLICSKSFHVYIHNRQVISNIFEYFGMSLVDFGIIEHGIFHQI